MRESERYRAHARSVLQLAAQAADPAERRAYAAIIAGWRKLASEARRREREEEPRYPPRAPPIFKI